MSPSQEFPSTVSSSPVALVTGAGTRVGAAIARRLGAEGMRVVVHYMHSERGAQQTCEAIQQGGGEAIIVRADLCSRSSVQNLAEHAQAAWGTLDLLVSSAANFERVSFDELTPEHWDRAMRLNLEAPFLLTHALRHALRQSKGQVIMITCSSTSRPFINYLPYVVSKAGLRQMMQTLALELAPEVRVNAIAPGAVMLPEDTPTELRDALTQAIPLKRLGRANDIAEAVLYLSRAPFVHGHELVVDGGHIWQSDVSGMNHTANASNA